MRKLFGYSEASGKQVLVDGDLIAEVVVSGQNNLNSSTVGNRILWSSIAFSNIPGLALGVAGNLELDAGTYIVHFEPSMTSTGTRTNIGWRFENGGTSLRQKNGGNYNRNGSGHNETGDSFTSLGS